MKKRLLLNSFLAGATLLLAFAGCQKTKPKEIIHAHTDTVKNPSKKPDTTHNPPPVIVNDKVTGLGFSPYDNGQDPNNNVEITDAQINTLTGIVAPYTKWIRTYGCTNGLQDIGKIAKSKGLKVAVGAWLSSDLSANATEISNAINVAKAGYADMVIVGSETILRGDLSVQALISYIKQVKAAIPANIPVTTADVYQSYLHNQSLFDAVDLVCVHIYPFWEGSSFHCSMYMLNSVYDEVLARSEGKAVWVGETGWPGAGQTVGNAVPSADNAANYFLNFTSWAKARNVNYFYFEFQNEAWKGSEGAVGPNWGLFATNGSGLNPGMSQVFDGQTASSSVWSIDTAAIKKQKPGISITSIPVFGSTAPLTGATTCILPSNYSIVVYLNIDGGSSGWWVKPYANQPLTPLQCDGTFSASVNTGGDDDNAHYYNIYVVPNSYSPPIILGGSLPAELQQNAVVWTKVTR